jgi:hypothetical protein
VEEYIDIDETQYEATGRESLVNRTHQTIGYGLHYPIDESEWRYLLWLFP